MYNITVGDSTLNQSVSGIRRPWNKIGNLNGCKYRNRYFF